MHEPPMHRNIQYLQYTVCWKRAHVSKMKVKCGICRNFRQMNPLYMHWEKKSGLTASKDRTFILACLAHRLRGIVRTEIYSPSIICMMEQIRSGTLYHSSTLNGLRRLSNPKLIIFPCQLGKNINWTAIWLFVTKCCMQIHRFSKSMAFLSER